MIKKCLICDKEYSGQKNDKGVCQDCLCKITKEFLPDPYKEIHNKYMNRFLNGKIAIKCNSEYDLKKLIFYLKNKGIETKKIWLGHWDYYSNGMYFYIKNIDGYDCLDVHYRICCGYNFFKRINFKKLQI